MKADKIVEGSVILKLSPSDCAILSHACATAAENMLDESQDNQRTQMQQLSTLFHLAGGLAAASERINLHDFAEFDQAFRDIDPRGKVQ
jgi:hypothetical protein